MRSLFNHPLGIAMPNGNLFKRAGEELMAGADIGSALLYGLFSSRNAAASNAQQHNSAMILNKKQYQYNSDLLKQADQYSAQQFARESQYNTPKAQAQRLAEAGLNPYLLMQDHGAGISQAAGNTASHAVGAPSTGSGGALPARVPEVPNFSSAIDRMFQASDLKNKQIEAYSKLADSIPSLVEGIGRDGAKKVLSSAYGNIIDTSLVERRVDAYVGRQEIAQQRENLQLEIDQMYGKDKAALINQNLIFEGQKIVAEINRLYSEKKLNDQSVQELITRSVKNVAEASKLNADAATVNALRAYVVKSASMQASIDEYDKLELETDFQQRKYARSWQRSPEGMRQATAAQVVSDNGETNLVNKIIRGKEPRLRHR